MQDEDPKVAEQALAPEPVVEDVAPASEPQPELVSEVPVVEAVHELVPVPTETETIPEPIAVSEAPAPTLEAELVPEPEPTPQVAPEPPPVVATTPEPVAEPTPIESLKAPEPVPSEPPKPEPQSQPTKEQNGIPQRVLDLTPAELDAARRLWATQNIKSVQAKSAHDRTARRDALLKEIEKYIKSQAPVNLGMVAYNTNISPRKTSDYLRILVNSGRVKATGATTSRKYS